MMDVDKLEAGRELDALVAEKVMEWKRLNLRENKGFAIPEHQRQLWMIPVSGATTFDIPKWSTDWSAAGEVVDKLDSNWRVLIVQDLNGRRWQCVFEPPGVGAIDPEVPEGSVFANAETVPLAICRAALKVTEG